MKTINSNIFFLLFCLGIVIISESISSSTTLIILLSYTCQTILLLSLAITIHEFGHFICGKLVGFKLIFMTSILGMHTAYKYYFKIPLSLSAGLTSMYKPIHLGKCKDKELILFYLGGGLLNLLVVVSFSTISYISGFEVFFLNNMIFTNLVILCATCIPFEGNDMARAIKILKNNREELNGFNTLSLQADPSITSEYILDTLDYTSNEFINNTIDLAKIEIYTREIKSIGNIKKMNFDYKNKDILWELLFFQKVVEYIETKKITTEMNELFKHKAVRESPILDSIVKYVITNDEKYVSKIHKYMYQLSLNNKILIVKNILNLS